MRRALPSLVTGLLLTLACSGCYTRAPSRSAAAASTLGPQAFVEEHLLSSLSWNGNTRAPGGGVTYVASFNETASAQLAVPRQTVETYCEAKGGKLVFVQLPVVQAADLSGEARPAVAELLRGADSSHQYGTFQCEVAGVAKWTARIEPHALDVKSLPKLSVFIVCDEQTTKLGGAPTMELVSLSEVARGVVSAAQTQLAAQKPLPPGAPAPHVLIDSLTLPGGDLVSEALLAIRLFRCEGTALNLGHDLLVCGASQRDECAQNLAELIARKSQEDSTRGANACAELLARPAERAQPKFAPVVVTALAASNVANGLRQGIRREFSREPYWHVDEQSANAQVELFIHDVGEPAREERAGGFAILTGLRCAGTQLYFGHHLGVSSERELTATLHNLYQDVQSNAARAGAYMQSDAARCAP